MIYNNSIESLVTKEYKYLLKNKILVLPINKIILNYTEIKQELVDKINSTENQNINTMHKYSYKNPFQINMINNLNEIIFPEFSSLCKRIQQKNPKYSFGFGISYNESQKDLKLHIDDSLYTINMCIENSAEGNEIIFKVLGKNVIVPIKEDFMVIHFGDVPHYTKKLESGKRTNIVMWFK